MKLPVQKGIFNYIKTLRDWEDKKTLYSPCSNSIIREKTDFPENWDIRIQRGGLKIDSFE